MRLCRVRPFPERCYVRDRVFIAAFACVLGAVIAGYAYSYATGQTFSRIEFGLSKIQPRGTVRFVERATSGRLKRYVRGAYQAKIQNFMRREFLFFDSALLGYSTSVTGANKAFYRVFLPKEPVVPLGVDSGNMFLDLEADALAGITLGNSSLRETAEENVRDALQLADSHPDIDFNYYGVTAWTMTKPAIDAGYDDPSRDAWLSFDKGVSGRLDAQLLVVPDWDEYFFRTDHHWNPVGAYQGYLDSMSMLAKDDPALGGGRLPFGEESIPGVAYRGASSRRAAYAGISEQFRVLTTYDPNVHAYLKGELADQLIVNREYLADPPTAPFADQYASYHGHGMAIHEYRNDAKPGTGNLLMFGDSFSRGMDDLVASHYDNTYVVDLRSYKGPNGEAFDFDAFVTEHDIRAVLVVGRPVRVMAVASALVDRTGVQ